MATIANDKPLLKSTEILELADDATKKPKKIKHFSSERTTHIQDEASESSAVFKDTGSGNKLRASNATPHVIDDVKDRGASGRTSSTGAKQQAAKEVKRSQQLNHVEKTENRVGSRLERPVTEEECLRADEVNKNVQKRTDRVELRRTEALIHVVGNLTGLTNSGVTDSSDSEMDAKGSSGWKPKEDAEKASPDSSENSKKRRTSNGKRMKGKEKPTSERGLQSALELSIYKDGYREKVEGSSLGSDTAEKRDSGSTSHRSSQEIKTEITKKSRAVRDLEGNVFKDVTADGRETPKGKEMKSEKRTYRSQSLVTKVSHKDKMGTLKEKVEESSLERQLQSVDKRREHETENKTANVSSKKKGKEKTSDVDKSRGQEAEEQPKPLKTHESLKEKTLRQVMGEVGASGIRRETRIKNASSKAMTVNEDDSGKVIESASKESTSKESSSSHKSSARKGTTPKDKVMVTDDLLTDRKTTRTKEPTEFKRVRMPRKDTPMNQAVKVDHHDSSTDRSSRKVVSPGRTQQVVTSTDSEKAGKKPFDEILRLEMSVCSLSDNDKESARKRRKSNNPTTTRVKRSASRSPEPKKKKCAVENIHSDNANLDGYSSPGVCYFQNDCKDVVIKSSHREGSEKQNISLSSDSKCPVKDSVFSFTRNYAGTKKTDDTHKEKVLDNDLIKSVEIVEDIETMFDNNEVLVQGLNSTNFQSMASERCKISKRVIIKQSSMAPRKQDSLTEVIQALDMTVPSFMGQVNEDNIEPSLPPTPVPDICMPSPIKFTTAGCSRITKITKKVQKRCYDLQKLIELDFTSVDIFTLPSLTEYALFIRLFGRTNSKQAYVQVEKDRKSEEIQTEKLETTTRWCQHPPKPEFIVCGSSSGIDENKKDFVPWNLMKLSAFLAAAGKVIESLLEELAVENLEERQQQLEANSASTDGCIKLKIPQFLHGRHVTSGQFSPTESHFLLLIYSQPSKILDTDKLSRKGIVCLWNVSTPEMPQKILVSESRPNCCCLNPGKPFLAFVGMNDGTLSVWDLREPVSQHRSFTEGNQEWTLRRPTYNTVSTLDKDNHLSPIVTMRPVLGPPGHKSNKQYPDLLLGGNEECLSFQLASLEMDSVILLWAVTETKKANGVGGSMADFCLSANGCIRLTKTHRIMLENPAAKLKFFLRRRDVFNKTFHSLTLQLLPQNSCHYYVGTDLGFILHGLRYGGRARPRIHFSKFHTGKMSVEVTSIDFCPFTQYSFLAGYSDGSIGLFSNEIAQPVRFWKNTTKNFSSIKLLHFSATKPGTFFVLDEDSNLYTWNLFLSTHSPVNQERLSQSRVTYVCFFKDLNSSRKELSKRPSYMAFFMESGSSMIHTSIANERSHCDPLDVNTYKLLLQNIS